MRASYSDFLQFVAEERKGGENEQVWKLLYDQFLDGLSSDDPPILIAVGGSPGAGKTRFRKQFLKMSNAHIHDMDEVMVRLSGYQKDLTKLGAEKAFEAWWPIAREYAEVLVRFAIKLGYSIIYDRTCGAEGSYFDLLNAKKRGYRVYLIGLYAGKGVAKERIYKREQNEARAVTEAILDEYSARFSALWSYYLKIVDEAALFLMNTDAPKLIFSSTEGVRDVEAYRAFLLEGEIFKDFFSELLADH